eukprot:16987-Heterococcus_DN1.PRE.1
MSTFQTVLSACQHITYQQVIVPDIPKWVTEPQTAATNVSSSQFNSSRNSYNRTGSSSSTREGWLGLPPKAPVGYQGSGPMFSTVGSTAGSTVTGASPAFAPLPAAREALAQLHQQQQVTGVPPDSSSSSSSSSGTETAVAGSSATASSGTTEKHHAHAPVTSPQAHPCIACIHTMYTHCYVPHYSATTAATFMEEEFKSGDNKVLLFDGHYLMYRFFFSMPPLTTPEGRPVGAVVGLCNAINKLVLAPALKQQRENQQQAAAAAAASNGTTTDSSHTEHPLPRVAFAFDSGAKSFRQALYPAYK